MHENPRNLDADDFWDGTDPDSPATYRDFAGALLIVAILIAALLGALTIVAGSALPWGGTILAIGFIVAATGAACMFTISKLTGEK